MSGTRINKVGHSGVRLLKENIKFGERLWTAGAVQTFRNSMKVTDKQYNVKVFIVLY